MLTDTTHSAHARAIPLNSTSVSWTDGFWKEEEGTIFQKTVPALKEKFDRRDISHVVENFRIAAGEAEGDFDGTVFGDGDFYKWLEAAMYDAVRTGNKALENDIDAYIDLIGRAQQKDGYLSTKQIIGEKQHNGVHRMGDINDFEVYNFGHLFTAAALYLRLTGRDSLLQIASKTADYLANMYDEAEKRGQVQTAVCPSHYMGLVELYRATGNQKYLDLARKAVALRDSVSHGLDDNQDRIPLRKQTKIHGHAVRANYLYAGITDLYLETGDEELWQVSEHCFDDLLRHKIYITGGCGALYNGASPYGNFMNHQLIHQAYGYAYQLPNVTAYNETCAGIGLIMWAYRMFLSDPKAKYFDVIERALLNQTMAAVSLDGDRFFYENMLERKRHLDYKLIWPLHRTSYITSYCCPPNLARCLAQSSEYAYCIGKDRERDILYTGIYGSSRADVSFPDGTSFRILQKTDYPNDGDIRFSFEAPMQQRPVTLALRIPVWAENAWVVIREKDGTEKKLLFGNKACGTYQEITLEHLQGTEVELSLPMQVRFTAADPMVEEDEGKACIERGPLVFCMESADLPENERNLSLSDLILPFEGGTGPEQFEAEKIRIRGREVTALRGFMLAARDHENPGTLYHRLTARNFEKIPVTLIPYYAWDNRSEETDEYDDSQNDEMKIWFPVSY